LTHFKTAFAIQVAVFLAAPLLAQEGDLLMPDKGQAEEAREPRPEPNAGDDFEITVKQYAETFKLSVDEAAKRLMRQDEMQMAIGRIEEGYGDAVAGAWIQHVPDMQGFVRLAQGTEIDGGLKELADDGGLVLIESDADPIDAMSDKMDDLIPGMVEMSRGTLAGVEIDDETSEIVLFFDGTLDGGTDRAMQDELAAFTREAMGTGVRIEVTPGPVGDFHTRGGANTTSCTSGFAVRHPATGTTGYITAGHCGDTQTYFEFGGTSYATTFIGEVRDSDQDIQWHTTPHIELAEIHASSTTAARDITGTRSRRQQSRGGFVCHRGRTTGYSCGTIASKRYRPTYTGACPGTTCRARWIRVEGSNLACFSGDSGGPFFLSNNAYGIMKGGSFTSANPGDCAFGFYMATNFFGIDVLQN